MHSPVSLEEFRRLCSEHGLAVTHQRQMIFEMLHQVGRHPTPEEVYEEVRKRAPTISLGTVYKTIRTFVDAGMVREVSLHHGTLRIEGNTDPHHHLVCSGCRRVFDLPESDIEPVKMRRRLPRGFRGERISVEVIGICESCSQTASSK